MTAGEVPNERVGRAKCKLVYCSNKKKRTNTPSLPEEIIFYILVWLPADILYNSMRYVCRQWYKIIRDPLFVKEHLLRSTTGLLIQENFSCAAQFGKFGEMNTTETKVNFNFPNVLLATCDGLVLFKDGYDDKEVYAANPLTKQRVAAPPFCFPSFRFGLALACAYSTMEYKLVCTYRSKKSKVYHCTMVTMGKDHAWKPINCQKLSDPCRQIFRGYRFSAGGFIYWAYDAFPCVVALDVESEVFYEFPSPAVETEDTSIYYVRKGKSLSCVVVNPYKGTWDVWVLSDPRSHGWRKLHEIDLDAQKLGISRTCILWPIAWVSNGDVLVSGIGCKSRYIAMNVKTGKNFAFDSMEHDCGSMHEFAYSLVSFPV
ncbi:hypothetical protein RHGRI_023040 [Rhododendron griersonianum]|uniref:F-box domain-containing protein n=1 Tax=Rhododendron griersonianum TaxID=479676 RepID=A0AAV6J4E4_9ERIC|nr:hypothetical protein RHGRI_023040 [Rhododendron griersonianum]